MKTTVPTKSMPYLVIEVHSKLFKYPPPQQDVNHFLALTILSQPESKFFLFLFFLFIQPKGLSL
jgi:hypothetical protein